MTVEQYITQATDYLTQTDNELLSRYHQLQLIIASLSALIEATTILEQQHLEHAQFMTPLTEENQ